MLFRSGNLYAFNRRHFFYRVVDNNVGYFILLRTATPQRHDDDDQAHANHLHLNFSLEQKDGITEKTQRQTDLLDHSHFLIMQNGFFYCALQRRRKKVQHLPRFVCIQYSFSGKKANRFSTDFCIYFKKSAVKIN